MVIDIDPSEKNKFTEVVDTALAVKLVLDKAGVSSYCKTSGASGLHVYVPLKNKYEYVAVRDFAHIIASLVQEQLPGITTLERSLSNGGQKFIVIICRTVRDRHLHLFTAYDLYREPVSTPLEWKEVNYKLSPNNLL
jgi:bifunctional non-homologous end joining protein LigD